MAAPTPPSPWIDFTALWQIIVVALIAGAGLPAIFALGLRALSTGGRTAQPADGETDETLVGGNTVGMVVAGFCFLVVLAAIGWGIWAIYEAGH
jgi:hypothetical protein